MVLKGPKKPLTSTADWTPSNVQGVAMAAKKQTSSHQYQFLPDNKTPKCHTNQCFRAEFLVCLDD